MSVNHTHFAAQWIVSCSKAYRLFGILLQDGSFMPVALILDTIVSLPLIIPMPPDET